MIGIGLFRGTILIEGRMCFEYEDEENTLNAKIIMNNNSWLQCITISNTISEMVIAICFETQQLECRRQVKANAT